MKGFYEIRNAAGPGEAELLVYGQISEGFWGDVPAAKFVKDLAKVKASRIRVRINSVGGSLFGGLGMYNALRDHAAEIVTVVEGLAASAASIVALAGARVIMRRGSMMMIHAPSARAAGNADDLRAAAEVLDQARDSIVDIYEARTGRSFAELQALVDDETWMTAAEAVAAGFADQVDEDEPAVHVAAKDDLLIAASLGFPVEAVPAGVALAALVESSTQGAAVEPAPAGDDPSGTAAPAAAPAAPGTAGVQAPSASSAEAILDLTPRSLVARVRDALGADAGAIEEALRADGATLGLAVLNAAAPGAADALRLEGAAAERARLEAIDELALIGHDDLVRDAKYGAEPQDAAALALAVVQAEKAGREKYLQDRAADAAKASVTPAPLPVDTESAARERATSAIVAGGNARRGVRS